MYVTFSFGFQDGLLDLIIYLIADETEKTVTFKLNENKLC